MLQPLRAMLVTESELASLLKISVPSLQRLRRLSPNNLGVLKLGRKRWYDFHDVTELLKDVTPE